MGVTDKVWGALAAMIKLEDKVQRQSEAMKAQQMRIEDLTARVIRIEAQLELLTGAALMNDQGLVKLDGPAMPKNLDVILQDPFYARSKTFVNGALAVVGKIAGLKDIPLPAMGLPILSGDQATLRKLAAHATTEQLSARGQAFHASTDDLARMKSLLESGKQPGGRFHVIHADKDTLADYATTKEWVGLLGPKAVLQTINSTSHVIEENPAEQGLLLDAIKSMG